MFELALAAVLAAAITVVDGGLVFQPALSPDGAKVAYAADENGEVSIYVVAATGEGPRTRVASVGRGVEGHRLAARSLLHRPWSADGKRLLYIAKSADGKSDRLHVVGAGGQDAKAIGPEVGIVESASWIAPDRIVLGHRLSRSAEEFEILALDPDKTEAPRQLIAYREAAVVDIAPSPDGVWIAMLHLRGPRDERVRELRILNVQGGRETKLAHTANANFLTWSRDSKRLFYIDTRTHEAPVWEVGQDAVSPPIARGIVAMTSVDQFLLVLEAAGILAPIAIETGDRGKDLGVGHVPVSSAGAKVAFVRRGAAGAAIVVAEATPEAIAAGNIGLPLPSGSAPAPPSSPAPPKSPDGPPPGNGGGTGAENGSTAPMPAGNPLPPAPPG